MFAQLGNIQFELITYFNGIKEKQPLKYAADFFIDGLTNTVQCCTMLISNKAR